MFKFTIRELLLMTLIAAIAIGWAVRERQLRNDFDRTKDNWASRERQLRAEFDRTNLILDLTSAKAHAAERDLAKLIEVMRSHGWTVNLTSGGPGTVAPPNR